MTKVVSSVTYKKGTIATNKDEIIEVIKKSINIEIKKQTIYDDNTQSIDIKINFVGESNGR